MLEQILEKIRSKGWNLYEIKAVEKATDKEIELGPIQSLAVGKLYVLFPKVDEPRSPPQIHEALRRLRAHNHPFPHIQYRGERLPIPYLSFQEEGLLVKGEMTVRIKYENFCRKLDSLNVPPRPN